MSNFYKDVLQKDSRFNSATRIKDMDLLEPGTKAAVEKLLELAKEKGHDLRVNETYRSQARQTEVFNSGASKLKKVGTHGYGLAVDFALFINGKYQTQADPYKFLVELCKEVGLISGFDWGMPNKKTTFVDAVHVQRIPTFRQNALFDGSWYPPEDYDPYKDIEDNA